MTSTFNSTNMAHILFGYIGLLLPILGMWNRLGISRSIFDDRNSRFHIYIKTTLFHLLQAIMVIFVLMQFPGSLHTVGTDLPVVINVVGGIIVFRWIWSLTQVEADKSTVIGSLKNGLGRLPNDKNERILFTLACTAYTISQELLYRGFLMFYLTMIFPRVPFYIAIFVSALLSGLKEVNYGWKPFVREFYCGMVMAGFFVVTGSIIPSIIVCLYMTISFWSPEYWVR